MNKTLAGGAEAGERNNPSDGISYRITNREVGAVVSKKLTSHRRSGSPTFLRSPPLNSFT